MSSADTVAIDLGDLRDAVIELRRSRDEDRDRIEEVEENVARLASEVSSIRDLNTAVMAALDERKQDADRRAAATARVIERVTSRDFLIFMAVVLICFAVIFGGAALDSEWIRINTPSATSTSPTSDPPSITPRPSGAASPEIGLNLHP